MYEKHNADYLLMKSMDVIQKLLDKDKVGYYTVYDEQEAKGLIRDIQKYYTDKEEK